MEKITELYNAYLAKEREERRINERIIDRELQIARLEKKKSKLGGIAHRANLHLLKLHKNQKYFFTL